MQLPCELLLF